MSERIIWLYLLVMSALFSEATGYNISNDTAMDSTSKSWSSMSWYYVTDSAMVLFMFIILISLQINYVQLKALKHFVQIIKVELMALFIQNTKAKQCSRQTELADFIPKKSYMVYEIDQTTSMKVLEKLIIEASKTKRFSYIHVNRPGTDKLHWVIEFIQENSSILVSLLLFPDDPALRMQMNTLFTIIFAPANTVYTWDLDRYEQLHFTGFDFINEVKDTDQVMVNVQSRFKQWYNRTFPHDDDCRQVLHFIDLDGCLCSCPHRPYKHPFDKWSLQLAVMFTFYEYLETSDGPVFQSLALTKLASVIEQGCSRDYIEAFSRVPSVARKVKNILL